MQHRVIANPMREFIHSDNSHVHAEFDAFKKTHKKKYPTELEHTERLHAFRQNLRYISSINRQGLSYRVAVNHLADKTDEELKVLRGKLKSSKTPNNGLPFDISKYDTTNLPDTFDWRIAG